MNSIGLELNPHNPWVKHSMLYKRLHGFLSYIHAAFVSLSDPIGMDTGMYLVLKEQFLEDIPKAKVELEWNPMSTAPKSIEFGATIREATPRILLRCGDEAVVVAYWDLYYAPGGNGYQEGLSPWREATSGDSISLFFSTPPNGWLRI